MPTEPEKLAGQYQAVLEQLSQHYTRMQAYALTLPEVTVGQSPRELVWSRNKARLYHYLPASLSPQSYKVPVLLVYALINKPYILDLRPDVSLIAYLVGQGYDVYLLDWGTPGLEDRHLKLDDYVLEYLPRAVRRTLNHSGATDLSILGYCLGATLAVCFAALRGAQFRLKNLVLLAAPLDFSEPGLLQTWLAPQYYEVEHLVEAYGLIPAEMLDFGSKMLRPWQNFVSTYANFWDNCGDEQAVTSWLSMQKWVNDGVPFAGAAFKQWVTEFYRGNKLTTGQLILGEERLDLSKIQANLLNIGGDNDHIVPASQSLPIMNLVSSLDKTQLTLPGGHVGMVAGRSAKRNLWPALNQWLSIRSDG